VKEMKEMHKGTKAALTKSQEKMKKIWIEIGRR